MTVKRRHRNIGRCDVSCQQYGMDRHSSSRFALSYPHASFVGPRQRFDLVKLSQDESALFPYPDKALVVRRNQEDSRAFHSVTL